jgi:hypothetical protein
VPALDALHQQLGAYFELLATGQDISPAQRYRLEGYLRACVDANVIEAKQLQHLKREHVQQTQQVNGIGLVHVADQAVWQLPYQVAIASVNAVT